MIGNTNVSLSAFAVMFLQSDNHRRQCFDIGQVYYVAIPVDWFRPV